MKCTTDRTTECGAQMLISCQSFALNSAKQSGLGGRQRRGYCFLLFVQSNDSNESSVDAGTAVPPIRCVCARVRLGDLEKIEPCFQMPCNTFSIALWCCAYVSVRNGAVNTLTFFVFARFCPAWFSRPKYLQYMCTHEPLLIDVCFKRDCEISGVVVLPPAQAVWGGRRSRLQGRRFWRETEV